ncbi:MAG: CHASE domain-containing protein [Nitrosomonadales bacterium]|nr:CHASE domain-containing protein [Nitrosomonadales bacterium]
MEREKVAPGMFDRLFDRRNLPAWGVLVACLSVTMAAWYMTEQQVTSNAQQQFTNQADDIINAIEARMHQHEQILLGGAGLFEASESVERAEWRAYVARLNLDQNYPGIQGVGYSQVVQPANLQSHLAAIRAEGFPQYAIRPPGERALYTSIVYLEPFSGRNLAAFGYDMMSEATRAKAMRRAVETGKTTITGKVTLVQENQGEVQAGFLMYLPVYAKNHPLTTPEQRWQAIRGFVYSPFRVGDLMHGILKTPSNPIDFELFDGEQPNRENRLYSLSGVSADPSRPPQFSTQRSIDLYGHNWTIRLHSHPAFEAAHRSPIGITILAMGSSIGVLLFILMSLQIFRRDRAEQLARIMTVEIRRNQEELRQSEARLAEGQRIAKLGSWEFNHVTGKTAWSDELFHLLETAPHLLNPNFATFLDFVHPEDRNNLERSYTESLVEKTPREVSYRLMMRDGRIKWVNGNFKTDFDASDKPVRSSGTIQDVTESKLARLSLQASEQRLHMALAASRSALWDADLLTGKITLDESWAIMLGEAPHETEISFQNLAKLVPAEEAPGVQAKMVAVLKGYSDNYWAEHRVLNRHGNWLWIESRGNVVARDATGRATRMIGTNTDISQRKRIDLMKSEFVSTVSHELRTPLTSISGALGLIAGGVTGELPAQAKQMVDIAYKNSLHLSHLINDLLDMEKLVAGKMQLDLKLQPLMPLVELSLESILAYGAQHQVGFALVAREDVQVNVDEIRLQQVMNNLLSNAAKFSPHGTQVEIAVRKIGGRVRVEVSDHGEGVPAEFQNRIFEKFSQADSSDTRQKGGTGLGLAISKELIERMNGTIGFRSVPGQGACFYFELPL